MMLRPSLEICPIYNGYLVLVKWPTDDKDTVNNTYAFRDIKSLDMFVRDYLGNIEEGYQATVVYGSKTGRQITPPSESLERHCPSCHRPSGG